MRTALVLAALFAVLASTALAAGQTPTLRLVDARPLTLRGEHFRPGERVFVLLHTTRPYAKNVMAGSDGSFTVQFKGAAPVHCGRVHATAHGASGNLATLTGRRLLCTSESIRPPLLPNSHG
jgi:hypothetical protein